MTGCGHNTGDVHLCATACEGVSREISLREGLPQMWLMGWGFRQNKKEEASSESGVHLTLPGCGYKVTSLLAPLPTATVGLATGSALKFESEQTLP
jgi:hypothetical protein